MVGRRFIGLVFSYDLEKLASIGRTWSKSVYRGKEFIFKYSAASFASFLKFNPTERLFLHTDDVDLMRAELEKYDVLLDGLTLIDWKAELEIYKKDVYPFMSAMMLVNYHVTADSDDYIIKLDNDLICKKKFDLEYDEDDILMWSKEGLVKDGNPLWGEKHACNVAFGRDDFVRYNMGVLGIGGKNKRILPDVFSSCGKLCGVDISEVTDLDTKIYHCCEQTAYNWEIFCRALSVLPTKEYFDHHFDNKSRCIDGAKGFLK